MKRSMRMLSVFLAAAVGLGLAAPGWAAGFDIARIYIEYNASANDLGYHVTLDGVNWKTLKIVNPAGTTIFEVDGKGPYEDLGMTELFFEGAEPNLDEFPLANLLALFPEGKYKFIGETVGGTRLVSTATLTHAVPAEPSASAEVDDGTFTIHWDAVTGPPEGFPDRRINIVSYQVLVDGGPGRVLDIKLPGTARSLTVPPELLTPRTTYAFEVLAIDVSGNQTITEGSFTTQ
jgi:hypothetical protein